LKLFQSEAARRLGISTVTLSLWECDKVYPTWSQQPIVIRYLGHNPFNDPALGAPKSNESTGVAFLSLDAPTSIGKEMQRRRFQMKKTRKELAREMGISTKTLQGWETGQRQPSTTLHQRLAKLLSSDAPLANPFA
jgi:DNA-binding XRE family transcriptional regulator